LFGAFGCSYPESYGRCEEAIQWQSIAQLHRAEGDLTAAASMEASAAEVLDVGSHVTGPVTIGNGNEVAVATRDSLPGAIDTEGG
jgi:hypothetical protein